MENELMRISTFVNFPDIPKLYATSLAATGLFYSDYENKLECYKCGVQLRNWHSEDNIELRHYGASPICSVALAQEQNTSDNGARHSYDNDNSDVDYCVDGVSNVNLLDSSEMPQMVPIHSKMPRTEHKAHSSNRVEMSLAQLSDKHGNPKLASLATATDHHKLMENTKSNGNVSSANINDMKVERNRLISFSDWPKGDVLKPESLARDGFFYMGTGDRVQCAFCKGILRTWEPGDDPEVEHTRHYPECSFVLGDDVGNVPISVDPRRKSNAVREELNRISTFQSKYNIDAREIKARLDTPQVRLLVEKGYSMDIIRLVLEERLRKYGTDFPNAVVFMSALNDKKIQFEAALVSQREPQQGVGAFISTSQQSASVTNNANSNLLPASSKVTEKINVSQPTGTVLPSATAEPKTAPNSTASGAAVNSSSNITVVTLKNVKQELETEKNSDEKAKAKKKKKKKSKAGKNAPSSKTEDDENVDESSFTSPILSNAATKPEKGDNFTAEDSHLCAICQDREINTAFIPCGHASTCDNCSISLKSCPMCRKSIDERFRIYLS